jgi:hypothetical protein
VEGSSLVYITAPTSVYRNMKKITKKKTPDEKVNLGSLYSR